MKRGQLTIFIILGLVLLLSIGLVIYFTTKKAVAPIEKKVAVPEDIRQVYDYVETCVSQITKDGIILLGAQGGYISLPPIIDRTPTSYIPNDPGGVSKTPLWYYEGEDRTPSLNFMQRELAIYLKQNIADCTGNFEAFATRFDIRPSPEILPVVAIADEEVIVELKWPIDVNVAGKALKLETFVTSFPVRLKQMWELADKTMQYENQNEWFENLTVDLMSANPDVPMSGMEFRCGMRKWNIYKVKNEVQNTIYYNLPYIRIDNTQYPPPAAPLGTYESLKKQAEDIKDDLAEGKEPDWPKNPPQDVFQMNSMRMNVGARKTNLKPAFQYLKEWAFNINAQPSDGATLSSGNVKGFSKYLRFLCINQWHFAYDVIYPVKMIIRDDTAFNGEGFTFQMGFPVIIEDNEGSRIFFGLRKFQQPDIGADFCGIIGDQEADIRALGFVEGGFAAEELEGVNITYRCLNQECMLGKTYSDGTGAIRLAALLPQSCSNPLIIAQKEGYLPGRKHVSQELVEILMTKLKRLNYTIKVHPYYPSKDNPLWLGDQSYTKFSPNEHATVSISIRGQTYDQYKDYPANATALIGDRSRLKAFDLANIEDVEKDELDFVWGDAQYDIDILLFKGDVPVGGYHAENMTIYFEEDIVNANKVTLHAVEWRGALDKDFDPTNMFLFLYETGKYADGRRYEEALRPTFT